MNKARATLARMEEACLQRGLRMTKQRRTVLWVMTCSQDHPTVAEIHERAREEDTSISISTVYRHVGLLEAAGIVQRHRFRSGQARCEVLATDPHDHLIDLNTGRVVDFRSESFERMKAEIARELGYRVVDCRVELYARPLESEQPA